MTVKFSELIQKDITNTSYVVGLYSNTTSATLQSNCKIPSSQLAKQADVENNYVNKNNNQSINGEKTFLSTINKQSLSIDYTIPPSSNIDNSIVFIDKNNVQTGKLNSTINTSGEIITQLTSNKKVNGQILTAELNVGIDNYNRSFATAPTPIADDNSINIATTEWAQTFIASMLGKIWDVGSIYIGTQASCPLATLIPNSVWEKIEGRYLLASGTLSGTAEIYNATATVSAGIPDHKHYLTNSNRSGGSRPTDGTLGNSNNNSGNNDYWLQGFSDTSSYPANMFLSGSASANNSVYGASTTVRPTAYVVNVWRRTR